MTTIKTSLILALILAAASAAGCSAKKTQVHPFPSSWPSLLEPPAAGASVAPVVASTLWVEPLVVERVEGVDSRTTGADKTAGILTDILSQKLRAAGVNVSQKGADYKLQGVVPWVGYTAQGGYPRQMIYGSGLAYRLVDQRTGRVVLERQVEQSVEQSVVVNTMTRLPYPDYAHEQEVVHRAVAPAWETAASGIQGFLQGTEERRQAKK